jgi:hypothetical protein
MPLARNAFERIVGIERQGEVLERVLHLFIASPTMSAPKGGRTRPSKATKVVLAGELTSQRRFWLRAAFVFHAIESTGAVSTNAVTPPASLLAYVARPFADLAASA